MSPALPARGESLGRYVLYDEIAAGGMATVHLGRVVGAGGFGRTVAIKRLHAHFAKDPEFVSMLLDEARLAARIHHPNVVPTLDVVSLGRELFLVMEYVRGEALSRLEKAARSTGLGLPVPVASSVLVGALSGLHAAHEAKSESGEPLCIVHRDVSPQNLLVGIDGVTRVLDFGVAKAAIRLQSTRDGQVKGKLRYLAPEQLTKGAVDRRTDVYAASVVLWEALTGKRLFVGDDHGAVMKAILEERVPAPSTLSPSVPEALDAIVLRGLSRDKEARFASAAEMAQALETASAPATPRTISEWLESIAGPSLRERARRVEDMEREEAQSSELRTLDPPAAVGSPARRRVSSQLPTQPEAAPASPAPTVDSTSTDAQLATDSSAPMGAKERPSTRRAITLAAAGGAVATLVLVLGVGALIRTRALPSDVAVAPHPPPGAVASQGVPPDTPPPPRSDARSAPAPETSTTAAPTASNVLPRHAAPAARPPKAKSRPGCDPPYTVDTDGVRTYKPSCF